MCHLLVSPQCSDWDSLKTIFQVQAVMQHLWRIYQTLRSGQEMIRTPNMWVAPTDKCLDLISGFFFLHISFSAYLLELWIFSATLFLKKCNTQLTTLISLDLYKNYIAKKWHIRRFVFFSIGQICKDTLGSHIDVA